MKKAFVVEIFHEGAIGAILKLGGEIALSNENAQIIARPLGSLSSESMLKMIRECTGVKNIKPLN